nr:AsmA-like C-terminal region-containing protein [uncultured Dethiosulfovibrio sp.]
MKKKTLIPALVLVALISLGTGATILPWGGGFLKKGFIEGLGSLGAISGDIGAIGGNPVRGYDISDLSLNDLEGNLILKASKVGFSLDLKALLSKKIRLDRVYIEEVVLDEGRLADLRPSERTHRTVEVEVGEIALSDISALSGRWSLLSATVSQDSGVWSGAFSSKVKGIPVEGEIKVKVEEDRVSLLSASVLGLGGKAQISGPLYPALGLFGSLKGLSIGDISGLFSSKPLAHGTVGLEFRLSGSMDNPVGLGDIALENGGVGRFEVPGLKGNWSYGNSKLVLSNWRGSASGTTISGDMTLIMGEVISLSAALEAADLDLKSLFGDDPRAKDLSGNIGALSLELKGPVDRLDARFSLEKGNILYDGMKISALEGKGDMKAGALALDLSASVLGGTAGVKGQVDIAKNDLSLTVAFRNVDADGLLAFTGVKDQDLSGALNGDFKVTGKIDDPQFSGFVASSSLKGYGMVLDSPEGSFRYGNGQVEISKLSVNIGKGRIFGKGTVKVDGMAVSLQGDLAGITGEGLTAAFPDLAGLGLSGVLGGSWSYSSRGSAFGTVNLGLSSQSFSLAEAFPLKNLSAQALIDGKKVEVKKLSAGLYGGSLSMSGSVPMADSGAMSFKGTLASVDGAQLMKAVGTEGSGRIDGSFQLSGSPSKPHLDLDIGSQKLQLSGLALDGLRFTLKTEKDRLVSSLKGSLAGVPLIGGGWVRLPSGKDKGAVDLEASVDGLDIKSLLPKGVEIGGTVSTKLHLLGPLGKTKLYAKGSAPRLQVGNTAFMGVELGGYLGQGDVVSFDGSSQFGDRRINVSCDLKPSDKGWSLGFNAHGKDVNLYSLASGLEGVVEGRVDVAMKGSWTGGALSASGKVASKELTSSGVSIKSVSLPITVKGTSLRVKGGKAVLYGGPGTLDLDVDLTKNTWKGRAEVKSADLKPLVADAASLPGTVSGTIDLRLDMSGVAGRAFLVDITGFLKGRAIEFSQFEVLKGVTKGKPFKVRDLSANFNLDGQELYILPGSRASAWPGDEVYRYLEASGSIRSASSQQKQDPLDLSCGGEVNLNALNAFLGAMRTLFKANILEGIKDPRVLATDLLSGIIGGYSSQEFRDISLHVGGSVESPVISKLKISDKQGLGIGAGGMPSSPGEPKIRIKIDIPTGEGGGHDVDAGDQVKKQLMEGLLKQVVGGSE